MNHKSLSIGILVLLVITGVSGISACLPQAGSPYSSEFAEFMQAAPDWIQVNINGFGDPETGEVTALEAFNGYLYAGTHNPIDPAPLFDGGQIFRSSDGSKWAPVTQPGFGNSHDIAPPAILDFVVFNNRLYAGTGRGNASQIWRSLNGTIWTPMDVTGFGDPDNVNISSFVVYENMIYAGVANQVTGAQIWRSFTGDNNSWVQVAPEAPGTEEATITGFAEFDGALYAAVESALPAQIWQSYGGSAGSWTIVIDNGFGDANTLSTGGMAVFGTHLYVGAGNTANGAQLWRTSDGVTWEQVISPGFGDPNNQKVEMVYVFQNQLYASVKNAVTGIEIWRSADGTLWEQVNLDGFGDSKNAGTNWSNATANFLSQLYVGTSNLVEGGELWRKLEQPADTPTPTATDTPTTTSTDTLTLTPTDTATNTLTYTLTSSNTPTDTATNTLTFTPTATDTATATNTSTSTFTPDDTATFTFTPPFTFTPTDIPTFTPMPMSNTPGKVTGGGVIGSNKESVRITFSFVIQYDEGDLVPEGNLTVHDHNTGLRLKATSFDLLAIEGGHIWMIGNGSMHDGQIVKFLVEVNVLSNPDQPDTFYIHIPDLNGYESGGPLSGGKITIH